jgi:hypothetical protein
MPLKSKLASFWAGNRESVGLKKIGKTSGAKEAAKKRLFSTGLTFNP